MPDDARQFTGDSFINFRAGLGYGADNLLSSSTYGFNPITRNHILLEWMYRGSWIVRKLIDIVADDMTRQGIDLDSDEKPDELDKLTADWSRKQLWQRLNATIKWARLYGGAIAVLMIRGQNPTTPLRLDTIARGQFQGLMVFDRWMVTPTLEDLVEDLGPDFGKPRFYDVVSDARTPALGAARALPNLRIHHSRCLRFDGIELPFWQSMAENLWGLSVIEPMFDRIVAYDSVTTGAAQLVYKAHLRVLKVPKLREMIAMDSGTQGLQAMIQNMRLMQANEGLTVIDMDDDFQAHQFAFGGLSDLILQFSQQISGGADVPITRFFGQSPAGLNSTGESDLKNYADSIHSQQEARLRAAVELLLKVEHRSVFGTPLPDDFNFGFKRLFDLDDGQKAQIAGTIATAIEQLQTAAIIDKAQALKELRQWSRVTGFGTNITDEDIAAAEEEARQPAPSPFGPEMGAGEPPGLAEADPTAEPAHGAPRAGETGADPAAAPAPAGAAVTGAPAGTEPADSLTRLFRGREALEGAPAAGAPDPHEPILRLFRGGRAPEEPPPRPRLPDDALTGLFRGQNAEPGDAGEPNGSDALKKLFRPRDERPTANP